MEQERMRGKKDGKKEKRQRQPIFPLHSGS